MQSAISWLQSEKMSIANLKVTPSYHNEAEENENLGDAIYHLPNQKKRERDWIINEIVDTEWKYITNLKGTFHFPQCLNRLGWTAKCCRIQHLGEVYLGPGWWWTDNETFKQLLITSKHHFHKGCFLHLKYVKYF